MKSNTLDNTGDSFSMWIDDVIEIRGRGFVAKGRIESGSIRTNDKVLCTNDSGNTKEFVVTGVEMFRKLLDDAQAGDNVGLLLRGAEKYDLNPGDHLIMKSIDVEKVFRNTLPENPKERKVIVLLKEEDIDNSSDAEWINSSKITVLKYPFDKNSPIYKNELYQRLDDADLIEQGAILVQSPYDAEVYRDAKDIENLIHLNALRKYSIFSGFCRKLGATRISIKDFANEQTNANRGGGGQAGFKVFGGEANVNAELENKLRQELNMEDTYPGDANPNIEEAKKYLEDNKVWHDEVLRSLLEGRTGSGKIQSKDISFSLNSETMQALKILGGIKLGFFNADGNYENKVSTLRDLKVSLTVEFGAG